MKPAWRALATYVGQLPMLRLKSSAKGPDIHFGGKLIRVVSNLKNLERF
jgi:hypothetical protein